MCGAVACGAAVRDWLGSAAAAAAYSVPGVRLRSSVVGRHCAKYRCGLRTHSKGTCGAPRKNGASWQQSVVRQSLKSDVHWSPEGQRHFGVLTHGVARRMHSLRVWSATEDMHAIAGSAQQPAALQFSPVLAHESKMGATEMLWYDGSIAPFGSFAMEGTTSKRELVAATRCSCITIITAGAVRNARIEL